MAKEKYAVSMFPRPRNVCPERKRLNWGCIVPVVASLLLECLGVVCIVALFVQAR